MKVLPNMKNISLIEYKSQSLKILYFTGFITVFSVIFFILNGLINVKIIDILFAYNPFFNCFIHADFGHLFYNITLLMVLLIVKENHDLNIAKLVLYAILVSVICSPFVAFGITDQMIGISGLIYLLITKLLLNIKVKYVFKLILFFLVVGEINAVGNNDQTSHLAHLIGIVIGFLIYLKKKTNE
jgi:hypothetical protein